MKSLGNRSLFRFTAWFNTFVDTPYSSAKSASTMTLWPRITRIVFLIRSRDTSALMLPPRDVRQSMKLHGDTVFIPNSQDVRLRNGCISDWLSNAAKVNIEAR